MPWPAGWAATSCRATSTARARSPDAPPSEHWEIVRITCRTGSRRYVVEKGSITVDGISLTVVEAGQDYFTVSLIPTTLALTTLGLKQAGRPGQPRGRRRRQVRRAPARPPHRTGAGR